VETNSIQGLFYIITHHFKLFLSLAIKRMIAFFGVARSYYSLLHNLILCTYFYLLYVSILLEIRNLFNKNKAEAWFSITLISLMTVTIMLSCDEWSNRFILSVLPFILLLAIICISNTLEKIKHKSRL
jgi:hypothetical protein